MLAVPLIAAIPSAMSFAPMISEPPSIMLPSPAAAALTTSTPFPHLFKSGLWVFACFHASLTPLVTVL